MRLLYLVTGLGWSVGCGAGIAVWLDRQDHLAAALGIFFGLAAIGFFLQSAAFQIGEAIRQSGHKIGKAILESQEELVEINE